MSKSLEQTASFPVFLSFFKSHVAMEVCLILIGPKSHFSFWLFFHSFLVCNNRNSYIQIVQLTVTLAIVSNLSQIVIKLIKTQFYPCPLSSYEFELGFYHKHKKRFFTFNWFSTINKNLSKKSFKIETMAVQTCGI